MASKLAGHGLQLLGHGLVFLGLGVVVLALFISGSHPDVAFWKFLLGSAAIAVPIMVAGGRIDCRGRGIVRGVTHEAEMREYRESVVLLAAYILFLMSLGFLVALPMLFRATGLAQPSLTFYRVWLVVWVVVFCGCRPWVTRPLWGAIERRVREFLKSRTSEEEPFAR